MTVSEVAFVGAYPWPAAAPVGPALGVAELTVAGLLRRRDVDFVERRRFARAAEAERSGMRRRVGQPPAGVSRSAEFAANAVWISPASGPATESGPAMESRPAMVEVRLVRLATGDVAAATRLPLPATTDPPALARSLVRGIVGLLDELGARPAWSDPLAESLDSTSASVSARSMSHFLRGLAAEEAWDWEGARRAYQQATSEGAFVEAETALARTARLRLGGTLSES